MRKNFLDVQGRMVPVHGYVAQREKNCIRLTELADLAEKEGNRAFTADEREEIDMLERANAILDVKINGAKNGLVEVTAREARFDAFLREVLSSRRLNEQRLERTYNHTTASTNADGMIPVTTGDVVEPLEEGLILKAVGLPLYTGLAGSYVIPTISAIEASVAGEAVALSDSQIDFGKIQPVPKRVGVTVNLSNQLINQTEGVAYNIVMSQLPKAMARTLNNRMFTTNTTVTGLYGPFKACAGETAVALSTLTTKALKKAAVHIAFAGQLPTYKELLAMKGLVLLKGVDPEYMAYVMDEYTKSELEATPRDAGSGKMIVEDGKIAGIPVFCTNFINTSTDTFIGFGCWGNEPLQQFGDMRMIVDPYSQATSDITRVTLNADWAMTTLRPEAFILGKCAAASEGTPG